VTALRRVVLLEGRQEGAAALPDLEQSEADEHVRAAL
jgi:hypothetical protein